MSDRERRPAIVVDRHDGTLTAHSKPGRTTFRVRLPFHQQ